MPGHGSGRLRVYALPAEEGGESQTWPYSVHLDCPESGAAYSAPIPSMFSFNSAMGACETCRGFGRVIGVDWGLVIPDEKLTLRQGAPVIRLKSRNSKLKATKRKLRMPEIK